MKQLWLSVGIMAAIFAVSLANNRYLGRLTGEFTAALHAAQQSAEAGDWASAAEWTDQVQQQWSRAENYLYVVLRHDETDAVAAGLREVRQLLEWEEMAEYTAANAALIEDIRLLAEMEQLSLKNLL